MINIYVDPQGNSWSEIREREKMKIPDGAQISFNDKGDGLITYPGDMLASIRVRKSDGAVRTAFLNEALTDKELEAHARQLVEEAAPPRKPHARRERIKNAR